MNKKMSIRMNDRQEDEYLIDVIVRAYEHDDPFTRAVCLNIAVL